MAIKRMCDMCGNIIDSLTYFSMNLEQTDGCGTVYYPVSLNNVDLCIPCSQKIKELINGGNRTNQEDESIH